MVKMGGGGGKKMFLENGRGEGRGKRNVCLWMRGVRGGERHCLFGERGKGRSYGSVGQFYITIHITEATLKIYTHLKIFLISGYKICIYTFTYTLLSPFNEIR